MHCYREQLAIGTNRSMKGIHKSQAILFFFWALIDKFRMKQTKKDSSRDAYGFPKYPKN